MTTLNEYNSEIDYVIPDEVPTGIYCDLCGSEIMDISKRQPSENGMFAVKCSKCAFTGFMK